MSVGSVDDGKSTLIGTHALRHRHGVRGPNGRRSRRAQRLAEREPDLALLTDGLKAEREQGITIDVAYRYFSTDKRKFIIADTPGHIQYTRNMVTGASTANVALILIDARHGVLQQSRRHAYIASLLGIPHLAVCVNKMDLKDYSQEVYDEIRADFIEFGKTLRFKDITILPGQRARRRQRREPTATRRPGTTGPTCSGTSKRSPYSPTATSTTSATRCSTSFDPTSTTAALQQRSPLASSPRATTSSHCPFGQDVHGQSDRHLRW